MNTQQVNMTLAPSSLSDYSDDSDFRLEYVPDQPPLKYCNFYNRPTDCDLNSIDEMLLNDDFTSMAPEAMISEQPMMELPRSFASGTMNQQIYHQEEHNRRSYRVYRQSSCQGLPVFIRLMDYGEPMYIGQFNSDKKRRSNSCDIQAHYVTAFSGHSVFPPFSTSSSPSKCYYTFAQMTDLTDHATQKNSTPQQVVTAGNHIKLGKGSSREMDIQGEYSPSVLKRVDSQPLFQNCGSWGRIKTSESQAEVFEDIRRQLSFLENDLDFVDNDRPPSFQNYRRLQEEMHTTKLNAFSRSSQLEKSGQENPSLAKMLIDNGWCRSISSEDELD